MQRSRRQATMNTNASLYTVFLAGVVAISFSPLAVRLVDFTPVDSAFYRSLYAAVFFLIFAAARFRGHTAAAPAARWLPPSILAGAFLGIDLAVWHKTIVYLGAGPATFMGNSQIIFVVLFASLVFKEHIPAVFYVSVGMILAGLYLLLPSGIAVVSRPAGYGMGLVVGMTYAGMLLCLRYARMRSAGAYPEILSLFVCFAVSTLVIALYGAGVEGRFPAAGSAGSHAVMALTALVCQTAGWYLINTSITRIPAHKGSLLLMLQPVLATVWGVLFFKEPFAAAQGGGLLLSLAGIVLYHRVHARRAGLPAQPEESFIE